MSPYVVMRMPMSMWLPNLDTNTPMVWGVLNVPENKWEAGPYDTAAEAEAMMHVVEGWEHA